jgi:hypothetical protein
MGLIFLDLPSPHEDKDEAREKAAAPIKKLVTQVASEFKAELRVLVASTNQHGYMMEDRCQRAPCRSAYHAVAHTMP